MSNIHRMIHGFETVVTKCHSDFERLAVVEMVYS